MVEMMVVHRIGRSDAHIRLFTNSMCFLSPGRAEPSRRRVAQVRRGVRDLSVLERM